MSKKVTNSDVFKVLENWAPRNLAYEWDNVGLQVGSYNDQVKKIMITLDVLESVVDEAIEENVDLIIAHHPLLFKSIKQINLDSNRGKIIQKLIQNNITVYASHTNLDIADGGVNDLLAGPLNLKSTEPLVKEYQEELFKIAVFVPVSDMEKVLDALSKSGAGHIGNYSHCTFQSKGQGTFKPLEGTNPYIGSKGTLEIVDEVKIETIVPNNKLSKAIQEMIKAHPYEEVAYDVYPLNNKGRTFGVGRIGQLNEKMTLQDFAEHIKKVYDVPAVRVIGNLTKKVESVAILGGSGEKYYSVAKHKGADVYITGDMTFHTAQEAEQMGLSIIDPGHHVEKVMKQGVKNYLSEKLKEDEIEIITSNIDTEPFQFI